MALPSNIIGPPVEGDDCFGRSEETVRLWNVLETQNVVLSAPRRVGKTSLLKRFAAHARANGARVIYVDVSGAVDEIGFIERMLRALRDLDDAVLPRASATRIKNALASLDSLKVLGVEVKAKPDARAPWLGIADEFAEVLAELGKTGARWYLLVDELPVLLKHLGEDDAKGHRVERLLSWCREVRQTTRTGAKVRWVFCGSIGLVALTNRLGVTHTVNDLAQHRVGPFDAGTARDFLAALSQRHAVAHDDALLDAMLARTRWHVPHHLQVLFAEVRSLGAIRDPAARVAAAFDAAIQKRTYYEHWNERLDDELSAVDARHARAMLEVLAKDPTGVPYAILSAAIAGEVGDTRMRQETVLRLVSALDDDGYVEREGERWRFRSEMLRAFWRRRYVP